MNFLEMGGYAAYVWPAFGITALVLAGLALASLRTLRVREQMLEGLQRDGNPGGRHAGSRKGGR